MKANRSFDTLHRKASKKGWATPVSTTFHPVVWMAYWMAMEEYVQGKHKGIEVGRPVAPH